MGSHRRLRNPDTHRELFLIPVSVAAKRIGCGEHTLKLALREDGVPAVKLGKQVSRNKQWYTKWYVNMWTLRQWVEAHPSHRLARYYNHPSRSTGKNNEASTVSAGSA